MASLASFRVQYPRQDEDAAHGSGSRYEFRDRRPKTQLYDTMLYDEVFQTQRYRPEESDSTPERSRKRRKPAKRASKKRRVSKEHFYLSTDESDLDDINRRIQEHETRESRAKKQAEAVAAEADGARRRYSLRSRGDSEGRSSTRSNGLETVSSPRKLKNVKEDEEEHDEEEEEGGDGEENGEEEEEDDEENEGEDNGDEREAGAEESDQEEEVVEHEEEDDHDEGANGGRYHLRRRTRAQDQDSPPPAVRRREERAARRGADHPRESSFVAASDTDNTRRYALRDRAKVQRNAPSSPRNDSTSRSAYADYVKRQQNTRAAVSSGKSKNRHRFSFPQARSRRRNRRRSSSSSSSSSSSDMPGGPDSDDGGMRTNPHHRGAASRKKSSSARADITPVEIDRSITWESVGGLESHIEALKEMVMLPLLYPEFYEKYKVTPPSGVLFYGPPGTGKTLLARALANSCSVEEDASVSNAEDPDAPPKKRHVTFYMRKGADCLSKWVGEAERQLRLLFEEAKRNEPSIIFFDEIDGLAPVRSAKQDQIHASIVSTLLALMDGMDSRGRVVVIGATNRLDAIDPALRRPGRFDRELGFKLPNVHDRERMLSIHARHWKPALSTAFTKEIAEKTVGYCGADVKALCAEATLCALRRVYPQVYTSQDKLLINLDNVVVTRGDFAKAMKKITPASHRSVSSFATPLPRLVSVLLQPTVLLVLSEIKKRFPQFPLGPQAIGPSDDGAVEMNAPSDQEEDRDHDHDIYSTGHRRDCEVCQSEDGDILVCPACPGAFHSACLAESSRIRTGEDWACPNCTTTTCILRKQQAEDPFAAMRHILAMPQQVGYPRVLLTGATGMGQHFVGAAILHALEGLTHFSLDYPALVADSNAHHPEEAMIRRMNEAQKCLPCVVYLPHAELWWANTSDSMHLALKMMLLSQQSHASLPMLFMACTSAASRDDLPSGLLELFEPSSSDRHDSPSSAILVEVESPSKAVRRDHFTQVFRAFATPPAPKRRAQQQKELEVLPLAPVVKKSQELNQEQWAMRKERDLHCLRELRIFLGQVLDYCGTQKLYSHFFFPVDIQEVPDYYAVVTKPMDLFTMREKLNDGEYTCFDQFQADVEQIVRNANQFNPKRSPTRYIAHAANTMRDNILSYAYRFRDCQGYDLFAKCKEITKRLQAQPDFLDRKSMPKSNSTGHVRASARLRGIAPDESETPLSAVENGVNEKQSTNKQSAESNGNDNSDKSPQKTVPPRRRSARFSADGPVSQWFDGSPMKQEPLSADVSDSNTIKIETDEDMEADPLPVFYKGDQVFVASRTQPGMNKEGGAGMVATVNGDDTYHVKYILGGSEKAVSAVYIKPLTESVVQGSVRNHRDEAAARKAAAAAKKSGEANEVVDEAVLKLEHFNRNLWPILKAENWTREDVDGAATKFYPPHDEEEEDDDEDHARLELNDVNEVVGYIHMHIPLMRKCYGKPYVEEFLAQRKVEGNASDMTEEEKETGEDEAAEDEDDEEEEAETAVIEVDGEDHEDDTEDLVSSSSPSSPQEVAQEKDEEEEDDEEEEEHDPEENKETEPEEDEEVDVEPEDKPEAEPVEQQEAEEEEEEAVNFIYDEVRSGAD